MTQDSPYSDALLEWAGMAHYALRLDGGIWALETPGGGHRYYLRSTDVHTLTRVERADPESFLISAADMADIEKFLVKSWGNSIRNAKSLPDIRSNPLPLRASDIAPGYCLRDAGLGKVAIASSNGTVRVTMIGGMTSSAFIPVWFSWILDASLEELCASYLDPDGLPLFPGCTIGPRVS